jgi:hypothetical protein
MRKRVLVVLPATSAESDRGGELITEAGNYVEHQPKTARSHR